MSALNSLQQGCSGSADADSTAGQELRIAGLFAILATSAIGVSLPLLSRGRYPSLLFIARCFGAGIVLATGFAHVRASRMATRSMTSMAAKSQHTVVFPCISCQILWPWSASICTGAVRLDVGLPEPLPGMEPGLSIRHGDCSIQRPGDLCPWCALLLMC
jgi:hypothetical protein